MSIPSTQNLASNTIPQYMQPEILREVAKSRPGTEDMRWA